MILKCQWCESEIERTLARAKVTCLDCRTKRAEILRLSKKPWSAFHKETLPVPSERSLEALKNKIALR